MSDSTLATLKHSRRVDELMLQLIYKLQLRITKHDLSKMEEPELSTFDRFTAHLGKHTYGSSEYHGNLAKMKDALAHHYRHNRHHPEHHEDGVSGMTLTDLAEMLADWKASTERHPDGDLSKSFVVQQERFGMTDQLVSILRNTAAEEGWLSI